MLEAFERLRPLILDHEQSGDQMMHGVRYKDAIGSRGVLNPRSDIRHVAKHVRPLVAALADDDGAAVYSDPHSKPGMPLARNAAIQRRHRIEDRESGEHSALGVVLVRMRITEVDQNAVSGVLLDVSAETVDGFGCALMVARYDLAPILWIELR